MVVAGTAELAARLEAAAGDLVFVRVVLVVLATAFCGAFFGAVFAVFLAIFLAAVFTCLVVERVVDVVCRARLVDFGAVFVPAFLVAFFAVFLLAALEAIVLHTIQKMPHLSTPSTRILRVCEPETLGNLMKYCIPIHGRS